MLFYCRKSNSRLQISFRKAYNTFRSYAIMAGWQSGHAAACKAVYAGSIYRPGGEIGRHKGLKIPRA